MPKATPEQIAKRNKDTLNFFVPQWLDNMRLNADIINRGLENNQKAHLVPTNGKDPKKGVAIIASGMSVWHQREHLKNLNDRLVICSPTNYGLCRAHGLVPDIIAFADSNPTQSMEIFKVVYHDKKTNIVTSPNVHPNLHTFWPATNLYWFKAYVQNVEGNFKSPYNFFIDHLFRNITDHIMQAGSVTNMALILVELLRKMGRLGDKKEMPHIFLVGSDLCVSEDNYHRAFKYHQTQTNWVQEPLYHADSYPLIFIDAEGKKTSTQMYNYRRSLLMLWRQIMWKMWNCSPYSLLEDLVPYYDIERLSEGDTPKKYDLSIREKSWKRYEELPNPNTLDGRPYDIMNLTLAQPETAAGVEITGSTCEPTKGEDK